ncbi:DUF3592 domain-containing protein [Deinococcus ficus]|uniref:DUF3592 domain-containing protein n=1 Tax=Deinococcus ficus TaxID=317577 RepID=A0A221T372_9DEIO|nr:DUF3592 domain-containing protein [Deinococcus ficus]ASN83358.1 hypothetical protein DFI_19360 [Deinococcus ficus]
MADDAPIVMPLMLLILMSGGALVTLLFKAVFGSRNWHVTDGVVTGTKTSTSDSVGRLPAYNAHIVFQYEVGPQTYDGEMAVPYFSARTAHQVIESHPAGTAVKVHFNPRKPAQSVLRVKSPGIWLLWIVTALSVFTFFCMIMAARSLLFE